MKFQLSRKTVKGLICSDNYSIKEYKANYNFIDCNTVAFGNTKFAGTIGTYVRFVCPPRCG